MTDSPSSQPTTTPTRTTPTPQPAAPAQPAAPEPASGPSEDAQVLLTNFKAIDRLQKGVGLDKIRMFYPKLGWNVILARVKELEDAGLLTSRPVFNARGGIAYQLYSWKEA